MTVASGQQFRSSVDARAMTAGMALPPRTHTASGELRLDECNSGPQDVGLALTALVALMFLKLHPWLVVLGSGSLE